MLITKALIADGSSIEPSGAGTSVGDKRRMYMGRLKILAAIGQKMVLDRFGKIYCGFPVQQDAIFSIPGNDAALKFIFYRLHGNLFFRLVQRSLVESLQFHKVHKGLMIAIALQPVILKLFPAGEALSP